MSALIVPRSAQVKKLICGDCDHLHAEGAVNEFVCTESPPQVTVIMTPAPAPHVGKLMPQPFATYPPRARDSLGCAKFRPKVMQ